MAILGCQSSVIPKMNDSKFGTHDTVGDLTCAKFDKIRSDGVFYSGVLFNFLISDFSTASVKNSQTILSA